MHIASTGEASDGGRRDKKGLKKEMKEACRGGVREKKRYKKDISKGGEVIDLVGDDEVQNLGDTGLFFLLFYRVLPQFSTPLCLNTLIFSKILRQAMRVATCLLRRTVATRMGV